MVFIVEVVVAFAIITLGDSGFILIFPIVGIIMVVNFMDLIVASANLKLDS